MATTILEALKGKQPKGLAARNESLDIVCTLVNLHMDEIEEAREHGYSWRQIEEVCKKQWETNAKCTKIIWSESHSLIMRCFQALKEGRKPHHILGRPEASKKTTSKKYNIEVTEA